MERDQRSFFSALTGDGVPLLVACAAGLWAAGAFCVFLSVSGEFLPHDIDYLGMTADQLCDVAECRVVDFMLHDRAAFGGSLIGVGTMYLWLALFPLRAGEGWAWWAFAITGAIGFASFLAYLSYGYLDSWHAIATVALFPVYWAGLWRTRHLVGGRIPPPSSLLRPGTRLDLRTVPGLGRAVLLAGAGGTAAGGSGILSIGVSGVFVPEDLRFIGLRLAELRAVPRLVPLIAHDRVGFGGTVVVLGLVTLACLWCSPPSRHLWQGLAVGGSLALAAGIGTHLHVGYTDVGHLLPVLAAAASLVVGLGATSGAWLGLSVTGPSTPERASRQTP